MKTLSFATISISITIALIASLSLISSAQNCTNPLLSIYSLTPLDAPQSGGDLPYCAGLQSAQTCCSADTVATFQDRANDIINSLNNHAAGRDLYVAQLRDRYLDTFDDILQDINNNHQDDLQAVRAANATLADILQGIINNASQASNNSQNISNQFAANFDAYQRARLACLTTGLEIQTSALCLACDPNSATQGVNSDGTVTFSDTLCQAISDACSPYFNQGADFNPLFSARQAYWGLTAVARYLDNHTTNGVLNAFDIGQDPYNPLPSQQPVTAPQPWAGNGVAGSAGLCQSLWANDSQLAALLKVGAGEPAADENVTRLLQDIPTAAIDEGVWAPDLTATGLDLSGLRLDAGDYFGVSDYSEYLNQTQNASDLTDDQGEQTEIIAKKKIR